jgi:hypothetical protein
LELIHIRNLREASSYVDLDDLDDFGRCVVNIGLATGVTLQISRSFIEEEFKKNEGVMEVRITLRKTFSGKYFTRKHCHIKTCKGIFE